MRYARGVTLVLRALNDGKALCGRKCAMAFPSPSVGGVGGCTNENVPPLIILSISAGLSRFARVDRPGILLYWLVIYPAGLPRASAARDRRDRRPSDLRVVDWKCSLTRPTEEVGRHGRKSRAS